MKKITLLSVSLVSGILLLVSFSPKKNSAIAARPATNIIDCAPVETAGLTAISEAAFKRTYGAEIIKVRKNVYNLTEAELNALKVGIIKMKSLPYTDPTSWAYQSAIHGTNMNDNLPSWNTCHRNGESDFFFAWHRMYLYFYERILRSKSGRANLTLPYWDYQTNPALPPAYRENSPANPLYDGTRNSTMNNGGSLPSSISTAFNNSMNIIPFYSFQNDLNGGPHGAVHNTISGNMTFVNSAAQDPVFWLHHSNVDRLWEKWLSMCNGRTNPTDNTWLNKTYTFFDENGTAVNMSGRLIVEVANQLRYRYDGLPNVASCPAARTTAATRQTLLTKEAAVDINGRTQQTTFAGDSPAQLEEFIRTKNRSNFNFNNTARQERLVISFEGVHIEQMPQGAVEVYLNLPNGAVPNPQSNNFAGLLDLFSAEHHAKHLVPGQAGSGIELDATRAAQALGLSLPALRDATLSFYVRGASLRGREVVTQARLTIKHIRFSVDSFEN
jgi:tyrosinase